MMKSLSRLCVIICPKRYLTNVPSMKLLFSRHNLLYTNTALSITVSIAGDLIQQNYQRIKNDHMRQWDAKRTTKMAVVGLAFGPCVHYWYLFLEKVLPGRTIKKVLLKVCMDQFIFSPFSISLFLIIVGLMEGEGMELLKEHFKSTAGLLFLTDMSLWTPAQLINFYFVPIKYRVLFDNGVSLLADIFYSYLRFDYKIHDEKKEE